MAVPPPENPSRPRVALKRLTSYQVNAVEAAVIALLEPFGGIRAFVRPGQTVLLKPNLLAGKSPEKAVTTHPTLVRAVIRLAQDAGGRVRVGDSPGIGTARQVARKSGILEVVEECGAEFAPFEESRPIPARGGTFRHLEVAADLLDADVIINLPKLKSHQMMGMTGAVKNMFGAVVGLRKPRLHLQAGSDKAFFARMLLELCEQLAPKLSIVDAVIGMEGPGPGSGDPVPIGALLAGRNPLAVDTVAGELLGLQPDQIWTQREALRTRRGAAELRNLELVGDALDEMRIAQFHPAVMTDVNFGLPMGLKRILKHSLTARPIPLVEHCTLCQACIRHCPAEVMSIRGDAVHIDYEHCIRCFCCQELCPHGALETRQGLLLSLVHRLCKNRQG